MGNGNSRDENTKDGQQQHADASPKSSSNNSNRMNEVMQEKQEDGLMMLDSGYRLAPDQDTTIIPVTRRCGYCENTNPIEVFLRYPCCGNFICRGCLVSRSTFCGECLTTLPTAGNNPALLWLQGSNVKARDRLCHLLGRLLVLGAHTYLDELLFLPYYERLEPPSLMLAIMNPPNVQQGVEYLRVAAAMGVIMAMLDLAEVYATDFPNDPFQKDKQKAEYWFRRALGEGNTLFPLAFTRYGIFLKFEGRSEESKNMFHVASQLGHARGRYEYAAHLLEGLASSFTSGTTAASKADASFRSCENAADSDPTNISYNDTTEAIKSLCKASKEGYYVPSYIILAQTIIETAEKAYGTAQRVGLSPLPRALQILALVEQGGYGCTEDVKAQAKEMLDRYNCKHQCSNCGAQGTEDNPLASCAGCGVVAYCSRICQRRNFRDGHKFDCCPLDRLFDFHLIKPTLPWAKEPGWKKGQLIIPPLQASESRSLMQMVEDDTDEVYGEDELDYDEHMLVQLMLRMRNNLERYLNRIVAEQACGARVVLSSQLVKRIDWFGKNDPFATNEFVAAMHVIRKLGNTAVHRTPHDTRPTLLDQQACQEAMKVYRRCKEGYEIEKAKA